MEYRFLGNSGLEVSALSFGAWVTFGTQMDRDLAEECMHAAFDAGVNFFDNAEVYAEGVAEEIMGHILARSGWNNPSTTCSTGIASKRNMRPCTTASGWEQQSGVPCHPAS